MNPPLITMRERAFVRLLGAAFLLPCALVAQPVAPAGDAAAQGETPSIVLPPFEVRTDEDDGYVATSTLGGTLIRTQLSDVGSAISVYTKDFLEDLGAFDNETLLAFTVNTDVGGAHGTFVNANSQGEENDNFGNGNANTRIRGLAAADNTLNYFKSDVPWDGYNTDRVDVIRGANSLLFGLGSPAGIINASNLRALDRNRGRAQLRFDEHGSVRGTFDYNQVLVKDVLSARVAFLRNDQKYRQKPAFQLDERVYLTTKFTPRFLQRPGSTFKLELSVETGDMESNSRRSQPPIDNLSYFFLPASEGGLEGNVIDRTNPAHERFLFLNYGLPNQRANPLIGTGWGNGMLVLTYDGSAQPTSIYERQINSANSYRINGTQLVINAPAATGSNVSYVGGTVQPIFVNGHPAYANALGLPFANRYQERVLTDAGMYNFFDNLIDGNSKREMREWNLGRAELTHTFFDNKLSYNLQYFKQAMDFDRYAAMGTNSTLRIDASALLPDGSPNPHAGKAYFRESPFTGSRAITADRDAWRGVLFFEHDFRKESRNGFLRALGQHFLTGTVSEQKVVQRRFDYMSNGVDMDYIDNRLVFANAAGRNQFNTNSRTLNYFYVSDSLAGRSLGQNLGIRNIGPGSPPVTGDYTFRYFDADYRTFNPNVDPLAVDPVYGRAAQNPNNYRGWTTGTVRLIGAPTDDASRDYLTRVRDNLQEKVGSVALAWQGKLLDGALVGTYGWREDKYRSWIYTWDQAISGPTPDPDRTAFRFDPIVKKGNSTNWSAVLHAHRLFENLPFEVTFLYAKGENTNPDPLRVGVFREPVLSSQGGTTDQSIVLSTKDGKWILRGTRFETKVNNASSTSTLQSQKFLLEQAFWQGFQGVYRVLGEQLINYGRIDPALEAREQAGTLTPAEATRLANQRFWVPQNIAAANAWLGFEQRFAERFPEAVQAWLPLDGVFPGSINVPGMRWSYPENAVLLEDTVSKGWEVELTANLTRNWRVSANVSTTEASRDNIPGARFSEVMDFVYAEFQTEVGRVPIFTDNALGGQPGVNNTPRERFLTLWDAYQVQLQQNGQTVGELSKYRFNFVTNYTFRQGALRGFSFGGSYRYESPKTIGYGYKLNANGAPVVDLDTVYKNEAFHNVGLSARYSRRLTDKVNWTIQANLMNAFQGDKVQAITTQPDGSMARGMIREGTSWAITNSFDF